jgi:drug/metabolite transporter (DMT)-like permease
MSPTSQFLAFVCVALIALGQVLFKYSAGALQLSESLLDRRVLGMLLSALIVYGAATLLWIFLLRSVPLGRLYPYMALSFVLVALASWLVFGERVAPGQIAGLGLIVAGLLVIAVT